MSTLYELKPEGGAPLRGGQPLQPCFFDAGKNFDPNSVSA